MLVRAFIVILLVMNLTVAAWWIAHREPAPPPPAPQPAGIARLQLLREPVAAQAPPPNEGAAPASLPAATAAHAAPPPAPATLATGSPVAPPATAAAPTPAAGIALAATPPASAPATPPPSAAAPLAAAAPRCASLGPFLDQAAAAAARAKVVGQASRTRIREGAPESAAGYRVFLPPSADRPAAQALVERIGAAGFDDFLIVNTGDETNGIALGRYRSREGADRRAEALKGKGFAAQVAALGDAATRWWIDLATTAADPATLRAATGAARAQPLDCAGLR